MISSTPIRAEAQLPITLDEAIAREGALTRTSASRQITDGLQIVNAQMTRLRGDIRAMEKDLGDRAERQISSGLKKLDTQLILSTISVDLADCNGGSR